MKDSPCSNNCESMRWFIDNTDVFTKNDNDVWIATWIELNRDRSNIDVSKYGVAMCYCIFCGGEVNGKLPHCEVEVPS